MGWSLSECVIRSFEKCEILVPIDGSEEDKINIANHENYTVDSEDKEEATDASDEDEDPLILMPKHAPTVRI